MKKLVRKLLAVVLVFSLVASVNSMVRAATTYHTTGMEDGLYEATTEPNADVMDTYYKLYVIIESGKVTTGSFELRVPNYPAAITLSFADLAPTKATQDFIKNTCPEVDDYAAQLMNSLDGAKVTKSSKAVADSVVFDSFNTLWKNIVKQAGGKIVADSISVKGVTLNKKTLSIKVGSTAKLVATVKPSDATDKSLVWTSSNKKIAKVDKNGKVTAVAAGSATITVKTKDGSFKATCKVTVKKK